MEKPEYSSLRLNMVIMVKTPFLLSFSIPLPVPDFFTFSLKIHTVLKQNSSLAKLLKYLKKKLRFGW